MIGRSRRETPGSPGLAADEEQRRAWSQMYAETAYTELPWFSPKPSPWLVQAVKDHWVRAPGPILDIGCGAGTNVLWLSRHGFRATGLDLAPGAIAAAGRRARRTRSTARFLEGSALSMPFRKSEFGAALDNGCFHTLPLPQRAAYAAEVARVIRPGGRFLLTWIAREETRKFGPPHRPSLQEVTAILEPFFTFAHTEFYESHSRGGWGAGRYFMARYSALLNRRRSAQPPAR